MNELFGPIIGITLVLMSVFLPAAFMPGLTGQMYRQFALVIAATALISAINAATLKPTQCALWLRPPVPPEQRNLFFRGFNAVYDPLSAAMRGFIGRMVARSALMCVIALIVIGVRRLRAYAGSDRVSSQSKTRATCWSSRNCPTAPRSIAPSERSTGQRHRQARSRRSRT